MKDAVQLLASGPFQFPDHFVRGWRQTMAHEAPVAVVHLALDKAVADQPVHDASQCRRRDLEALGEHACGRSFVLADEEKDAELGHCQPQAGPGLEAAGVGSYDGPGQEVEGLFELIDVMVQSLYPEQIFPEWQQSTTWGGRTNCDVTITPVNEFESTTENEALKRAIIARIERDGPITFRDFMEMALYAPNLGYYTSRREKMGRSGDYVTSPEVSPIFGAMIGRQVREMWQALGRPAVFDVVEAGAGNGTLCRDILRWSRRAAPDFHAGICYTILETSAALTDRQRETVEAEGLAESVGWRTEFPEAVEGCILSNELLDALPVHRVAVRDGALREVYVASDGAGFREELGPLSTTEIDAYFGRLGILPGEGCYAEVNLAAPAWIHSAARALRCGFLVTFDYGYEANDLYAPWRTRGTLLCFYRHNPSEDPFARIGRQDMTSHVDFTTVRRAGEEACLRTLGLVPQSEFLMNLGLPDALPAIGEGETNLEEYYVRRRAVVELVDPAGLGRIKVLVQAKGVGEVVLTGLRGGNDA